MGLALLLLASASRGVASLHAVGRYSGRNLPLSAPASSPPRCASPPLRCPSAVLSVATEERVTLSELLSTSGADQRLIFVGGKGGVGKTTSSSAIAVRCADAGLRTLIVSTDPAHSLSDALMQDISGGSAMDVVGCENLQAMEVETGDAVDRFRAAVSGFRAEDLGLGGVAEDVLSQLGLDEFADILDNTPPGLDELLALAEVLALVRSEDGAPTAYDRIIFDTAPTGHTLRLLAFPEFIDSLLGKLLALKSRLAGALSLLKGLLGAGAADPADKLELAVDKLQLWRSRMENLKQLLTDEEVTDFVVVGIPSRLAVAECARLLAALVEQEIPVRHLIVNQVVDQGLDVEKQRAYLDRISAEQSRTLSTLERLPLSKMGWARVPFYDLEMRGVYPLRFLGSKAFGEDHAELWERILSEQRERFVLVGGKGGVGKTTTSAALAVACADAGYDTLLISTDPAHSLGDALELDLSSGAPQRVEASLKKSQHPFFPHMWRPHFSHMSTNNVFLLFLLRVDVEASLTPILSIFVSSVTPYLPPAYHRQFLSPTLRAGCLWRAAVCGRGAARRGSQRVQAARGWAWRGRAGGWQHHRHRAFRLCRRTRCRATRSR